MMPFFKVTPRAKLIEASDAVGAAMLAYRMLEDQTPSEFEVVGPDAEVEHVVLSETRQDEAISIGFKAQQHSS
jgi:hypothetical protein